MNIANCPHCGGRCVMDRDRFYGSIPRWQIRCDQPVDGLSLPGCGYASPMSADHDTVVRAHNKIAQNCGVVC